MSSLRSQTVIGDVPDDLLTPEQDEALRSAVVTLLDEFFSDLNSLAAGGDFEDTSMTAYLPARFLPKYNYLFAKEFLICVAGVGAKLVDSNHTRLACVGEELALHAIVDMAEALLDMDGHEADLSDFLELANEDGDYELLFDMAWDGIEDSEDGRDMRVVHLAFDDWFKPFRGEYPVHPYVEPDSSSLS